MSSLAIHQRILVGVPELGVSSTDDLVRALRKQLVDAYGSNHLNTPHEDIHRWVRKNPRPEADEEILGGERSSRDPTQARLVRDDGAWIHFKIRVRPQRPSLALVAYVFEIVLGPAGRSEGGETAWLRVDLNPTDHPNELRSHIHPGNDDIQWPAPIMTPQEILHHMIYELRPRTPGKPRA